jgi:hypothetical protein
MPANSRCVLLTWQVLQRIWDVKNIVERVVTPYRKQYQQYTTPKRKTKQVKTQGHYSRKDRGLEPILRERKSLKPIERALDTYINNNISNWEKKKY